LLIATQERLAISNFTSHQVCELALTETLNSWYYKDYPDPSELMVAKRQVLLHFVPIIRRLSELYKLPPTSLHIFYDQVGSTIAFNGNGSLFCNARYFEAWRKFIPVLCGNSPLISFVDNTEVSQGSLSGAYISWSVSYYIRGTNQS
jgi:hypothetical protein